MIKIIKKHWFGIMVMLFVVLAVLTPTYFLSIMLPGLVNN